MMLTIFQRFEIPITRLSEPKNYSVNYQEIKKTVLCAELPCFDKFTGVEYDR